MAAWVKIVETNQVWAKIPDPPQNPQPFNQQFNNQFQTSQGGAIIPKWVKVN